MLSTKQESSIPMMEKVLGIKKRRKLHFDIGGPITYRKERREGELLFLKLAYIPAEVKSRLRKINFILAANASLNLQRRMRHQNIRLENRGRTALVQKNFDHWF